MNTKPIRQQFADTMLDVGKKDKGLVVLVGDISHFRLQPFAKACPGRYYNVGICEPTIVNMAAGLARVGFFPVVHTIAPFIIERAFEQIKLDFCYQDLGVSLISCGSAFDYSTLGYSHHCYDDFSLIKGLPGTQIIYPGMANEFDTLFKQTYGNGRITYMRITNHSHGVKIKGSDIKFGKGVRVREGKDLTIVATGGQLKTAMDTLPLLQDKGIDTEVIYIHTIKPLDNDLILKSVNKTKRVLIIEEHNEVGGLGDEVIRISKNSPGIRYAQLGIPETIIHSYGTYQQLAEELGFTPKGVMNKVSSVLGLGKKRKKTNAKGKREAEPVTV